MFVCFPHLECQSGAAHALVFWWVGNLGIEDGTAVDLDDRSYLVEDVEVELYQMFDM